MKQIQSRNISEFCLLDDQQAFLQLLIIKQVNTYY